MTAHDLLVEVMCMRLCNQADYKRAEGICDGIRALSSRLARLEGALPTLTQDVCSLVNILGGLALTSDMQSRTKNLAALVLKDLQALTVRPTLTPKESSHAP